MFRKAEARRDGDRYRVVDCYSHQILRHRRSGKELDGGGHFIGKGLRGDAEARRKAQRQAEYINEWQEEQEDTNVATHG